MSRHFPLYRTSLLRSRGAPENRLTRSSLWCALCLFTACSLPWPPISRFPEHPALYSTHSKHRFYLAAAPSYGKILFAGGYLPLIPLMLWIFAIPRQTIGQQLSIVLSILLQQRAIGRSSLLKELLLQVTLMLWMFTM